MTPCHASTVFDYSTLGSMSNNATEKRSVTLEAYVMGFATGTRIKTKTAKHSTCNAGSTAGRARSGHRYSPDCSLCQVCVPLQLDLA